MYNKIHWYENKHRVRCWYGCPLSPVGEIVHRCLTTRHNIWHKNKNNDNLPRSEHGRVRSVSESWSKAQIGREDCRLAEAWKSGVSYFRQQNSMLSGDVKMAAYRLLIILRNVWYHSNITCHQPLSEPY
jgi:hypothetical protein